MSVPISQVRRVIARRLSASAREIPHFYVTAVADAQALTDLRATLNAQLTEAGRAKVSVNDLLIRACALALREHQDVNVSYGGDASSVMLVHDRVNVGVAVAAESGLIVPVIRDADTKTVTQLGAEAKKLVALAAERKLTPAQTSGGTFTISNLGMYGVEQFTAIINPPESAILAVGATTREPTVVGDTVRAPLPAQVHPVRRPPGDRRRPGGEVPADADRPDRAPLDDHRLTAHPAADRTAGPPVSVAAASQRPAAGAASAARPRPTADPDRGRNITETKAFFFHEREICRFTMRHLRS